MTTCTECDYNLPHHSHLCSQSTPLTYLCPDHAPRRPAANDDSMTLRPCATCSTPTRRAFRI